MNRLVLVIIGGAVATAALVGALAPQVNAQSGNVQSLRGAVAIPEQGPPPDLKKQNTTSGRFNRAYRQQPPMVPHKIDHYQIDLRVNQCLRCHDWPYNVEENAPKVSETHYMNRDGVALDHVTRSRWFCTQCHVPQDNARPLVRNQFKSAVEVE